MSNTEITYSVLFSRALATQELVYVLFQKGVDLFHSTGFRDL